MRALRAEVRGSTRPVDAVVARARELAVLGWVREDGGVLRAHLEGPDAAVDELRAFLGEGAARADAKPVKAEGHEQFAVRGVAAGAFAVRETPDGYELRLEVAGAPRCWLLRKEPSMHPKVRRMAIERAPAEGGAAWDEGPYEQGGRVPWPEALERGHAVFVLHGERLRGGFALQRTRGEQWLMSKRRDEHAL